MNRADRFWGRGRETGARRVLESRHTFPDFVGHAREQRIVDGRLNVGVEELCSASLVEFFAFAVDQLLQWHGENEEGAREAENVGLPCTIKMDDVIRCVQSAAREGPGPSS